MPIEEKFQNEAVFTKELFDEHKKVSSPSISMSDLLVIKNAKTKVGHMAQRAEKAILESQLADLEHRNLVLSIYLKYRLNDTDTIDESSGEIIRKTTSNEETKEAK